MDEASVPSVLGSFRRLTDPLVERSPRLVCFVARHRRSRNRVVVGRGIELVVEGFPRSGNTTLVVALGLANPGLAIASHVHRPAHLTEAVRRRVPAVAVFREPWAAVQSALVYAMTAEDGGRYQAVELLGRWATMYRTALELDVPLVSFERICADIDAAVRVVAGSTGLELVSPASVGVADAEIQKQVTTLGERRHGPGAEHRSSSPSATRRDLLAAVEDHLGEYVRASADFQRATEIFSACNLAAGGDQGGSGLADQARQ